VVPSVCGTYSPGLFREVPSRADQELTGEQLVETGQDAGFGERLPTAYREQLNFGLEAERSE
jgi:hypothetical protein